MYPGAFKKGPRAVGSRILDTRNISQLFATLKIRL